MAFWIERQRDRIKELGNKVEGFPLDTKPRIYRQVKKTDLTSELIDPKNITES